MAQEGEHPEVVFQVRVGRQQFTCRGHLVWEGGIVFAIPDPSTDDFFAPERVRLEESDLELKRDESGREWYQYHGYVMVF
jgi:hypothetical protein